MKRHTIPGATPLNYKSENMELVCKVLIKPSCIEHWPLILSVSNSMSPFKITTNGCLLSQISVLSCCSGVSYDNRCWEPWPGAQWVAPASGSGSVAIRSMRALSRRQDVNYQSWPRAQSQLTRVWEQLSTGTQGPARPTVAQEPGQLTQSIINFLTRHGKIQ